MNERYLISLPYLYPVCPISIDHARMFVVADINARLQRKNGNKVCFPIAAHFSGITAEKTSRLLNSNFEKDNKLYNEKRNIYNIFSRIYKIPDSILKLLQTPLDILYYFTYQIVSNLKEINISCDYDSFYTTYNKEFEAFVKVMFEYYEKNNVLVLNEKNELALNYSNVDWKKKTINSMNNIDFLQKFHKNNIMGAFENLREDFGLLRDYGIGIKYNENYVIDPMFDSDLFTLFDLYMKYKDKYNNINVEEIFRELFLCLKNKNLKAKDQIVKNIMEWLPCDLFVCEEHLKTWIVKKTYSETLLLDSSYRTKKYFITGMGKIGGERMSSSKGTAVLLKDLIAMYGNHNARIIILMTGGHPSKLYNYDLNLPNEVVEMTKYFKEYINYLNSVYLKNKCENIYTLEQDREKVKEYIEEGYYKQAIIHMMRIIPKNNKNINASRARAILELYNEYLEILVPGLLNIKL